jgi:hypothetical protein
MPSSRTLGVFDAPAGLPLAEYDAVNERVSRRASGNKDVWHGFASAWNGVAYRLRAAHEHADGFRASISASSAPEPNERYRQDHDLFGFVVSALSTLECFFFASYCIGSLLDTTLFPLSRAEDLKKPYPKHVSKQFRKAFPNDVLSSEMDVCLSSHEFKQLSDLRNVLAHRGTPPRQHFLGTGNTDTPSAIPGNLVDPASGWRYDFPLDPRCLDPYQTFLDKTLSQLVIEASRFVNARL